MCSPAEPLARSARVARAVCAGCIILAQPASSLASSELFKEIAKARDLICELHAPAPVRTRSRTVAGSGTPRANAPRNLMIVIENVATDSSSARLVSSATVGARQVHVYPGETGVHFVEDVESSVKVTTLMSCIRWGESRKGRQCTRYDAVNRWHFDTSVHRNPDQAFLRLAENSYTGWCEPWRMD